MSRCEQEMCPYWTGDGCACAVFDLDPTAEGVAFWQRYGHGPGDGCTRAMRGGARLDVWNDVHKFAEEVSRG